MRDIEALIAEYCAQDLPPEPLWITIVNRQFPRIAKHLDAVKSVRWEIEDHLRNSYEAFRSKEQSPDLAWKSAREHFGNAALISQEICRVRSQSHKCLILRILAIITLLALPVGKTAQLRFPPFFSPSLLFFLAICAVAVILLSTFYGLFLATPSARGIFPAAMMVICQAGVLIPAARFGLLSVYPRAVDASSLKTVAAFSIVSLLVGLTVYDVRRLHRRLAGLAGFSMIYTYIQILSNLSCDNGNLFYLVCATSIPPIVVVLIALPIQRLQSFLLREAN